MFGEFVAGLGHLALDYVVVEAVVGSVAIAVDDADLGSGLERCADELHEGDGMRDLVVDLEEQDRVDGVGGEFGVIGCAQDGADVGQLLGDGALVDVVDGPGVDVLGDDGALSVTRRAARTLNQPEPAPMSATVLPGVMLRRSMTRSIWSFLSRSGYSKMERSPV